jgi:hypothetical protein
MSLEEKRFRVEAETIWQVLNAQYKTDWREVFNARNLRLKAISNLTNHQCQQGR